jgi:hypothetical protein
MNSAFSQLNTSEFEGRIYYTNSFNIKQPVVDSINLVKSFGSSSIYTYKAGKFLWTSKGSQFQYELYNSSLGLLVDKYEGDDTLHRIDIFNKGDSLLSYEIIENAETICGYKCNAIKVVLQSTVDSSFMQRTIFYSPQLYVNPEYFKYYKSYANYKIYPLTKAIPLKIVTEYSDFPIEITVSANKVEPANIDDNEFELDKSLFIK